MGKIKIIIVSVIVFCFSSHLEGQNSINVMSFNIRYNNPSDGINQWENRKDWVTDLINYREIDLLGTQEVTYTQLMDMKERLPLYDVVGIGREGGNKGEFSAIFYNKSRFKLLDAETFWLSTTPKDTASVGWDAALPRIVTYAKLLDKRFNKEIYFFNTHFDHKGEEARLKSANLLVQEIKRLTGDLPVIITGDFNSSESSSTYKELTSYLKSTAAQSPISYGNKNTYNGWDYEFKNKYETIDYIFFKGKGISPLKYEVIDGQRGKHFISDHYPVFSEFRYTGDSITRKTNEALRIISYNIHHGLGEVSSPQNIDMRGTIDLLANANAEIICLQEIDKKTFRSGKKLDQLDFIASELGMHSFFGKTLDYDGGEYGIGLLSKMPFKEIKFEKLPNPDNKEPRGIIVAKISIEGKVLPFACTHLSNESPESRLSQTTFISENYKDYVLAGDFNSVFDSKEIQLFNHLKAYPENRDFTYSSMAPIKQIDYFFIPENKYIIENSGTINNYGLSDHKPIYIDLKQK